MTTILQTIADLFRGGKIRDFLCHPDPECGASLDIKGYRQVDSFGCGAIAGWMVVNTFNPEFGFERFYEACAPSPERGVSVSKLAKALRTAGIVVRTEKKPLTFHSIKRKITEGLPIIATIDCPGRDYAHWVVVYGYGETKKQGRKKQNDVEHLIFVAGNNWMGLETLVGQSPNPMKYQEFANLSKGCHSLVCWGKSSPKMKRSVTKQRSL